MNPTRAILIAAGRGKRLGSHTEEIPKCMVDVGGAPIVERVWRAFAAAGIEELVVVRGYHGDVLERFIRPLVPRVTFVDNHDWPHNNILLSLAHARAYLDQPVLISYSDIIFTPAVALAAARSPAEIGLVIDRDFRSIYVGRTEHPLDEGEVADLRPDGSVARVGKRALPVEEAAGEFIGLASLGAAGVATFTRVLDRVAQRFANRGEIPFQRAAAYRNAYLTDLLQEMIDSGDRIDPIFIDGHWREIDTNQDLERARALVTSAPQEWS